MIYLYDYPIKDDVVILVYFNVSDEGYPNDSVVVFDEGLCLLLSFRANSDVYLHEDSNETLIGRVRLEGDWMSNPRAPDIVGYFEPESGKEEDKISLPISEMVDTKEHNPFIDFEVSIAKKLYDRYVD